MRVEARCALVHIPVLRRSTLGLAYHPRKRTRFGPNGSPGTNDLMLPIAPFYQSINCWPTFFYQWKRKLATDLKDAQSCVFKPPSPPSTPWILKSPLEFQSSFRDCKNLGDCPRGFVIRPPRGGCPPFLLRDGKKASNTRRHPAGVVRGIWSGYKSERTVNPLARNPSASENCAKMNRLDRCSPTLNR